MENLKYELNLTLPFDKKFLWRNHDKCLIKMVFHIIGYQFFLPSSYKNINCLIQFNFDTMRLISFSLYIL